MGSDEALIQTTISSWEQVINRVGTLRLSCSEEQTISRGRAWEKPHLVPLGTPHRRKRCDVQRLAAGRAATPGIGRRLHRATGPISPASNLHRDCQVLGGRSCFCQLDLAPFDALIWPHLVLFPPARADASFDPPIFPEYHPLMFLEGAGRSEALRGRRPSV